MSRNTQRGQDFRIGPEWAAALTAMSGRRAAKLIRALWMYKTLGIAPRLRGKTALFFAAMTAEGEGPETPKEKKNQKEKALYSENDLSRSLYTSMEEDPLRKEITENVNSVETESDGTEYGGNNAAAEAAERNAPDPSVEEKAEDNAAPASGEAEAEKRKEDGNPEADMREPLPEGGETDWELLDAFSRIRLGEKPSEEEEEWLMKLYRVLNTSYRTHLERGKPKPPAHPEETEEELRVLSKNTSLLWGRA